MEGTRSASGCVGRATIGRRKGNPCSRAKTRTRARALVEGPCIRYSQTWYSYLRETVTTGGLEVLGEEGGKWWGRIGERTREAAREKEETGQGGGKENKLGQCRGT